ncbi:uncharacterized protein LOC112463308 isoform X2 [Temnothorax curvispinosus]|uniref:Uncharacterized protein LOC112463308 isoform X2 n=1 Tax=Temnothorax curvispinosus TaxID=300111 RepID=A0A6J1QSS3_9HYME|nr:uncharacterized protein LOC112463308 isoform X2 [Temnothorax curvispinosus]
MAPNGKRSKLWNYFEQLKPSLVKCTICKKEITIPQPTRRSKIFRAHLLIRHGIFLDNDTLPADLRQYYSKLPGHKVKCNDCGKTKSFLTNIAHLRKHLRRHSTRILSQDESSTSSSTDHDMDPTNLERQIQEIVDFVLQSEQSRKKTRELDGPNTSISMSIDMNPAVECQIQESPGLPVQLFEQTRKEISAFDKPSVYTSSSADYSMDPTAERQSGELSGSPVQSLKEMAEETGALDKPSTSSLADYSVDPTAERQSEELSGLPVQSFKEKTGALNESSTLSLADNGMDPSAEHQSQNTSGLPVQSFKETTEKTGVLNESSTSSSMDFNINPSAERRSQKTVDLGPQTCEQSRKETRARDRSVIVAPKRKRSKLWNCFEQLKPSLVKCAICKMEIYMPHPSNSTAIMIGHLNRHGIFFNNDTVTLPDDLRKYYLELPEYKAKCNDCGKTMSFLTNIVRLRKHLRRHSTRILSRDEPSTSSLADNGMGLSAGCQSQDTSGLPVQSFKETTEKTGALNESSTLSLADNGMDSSNAERQSQDTSGLPVQSFKETTEKTGALNESSTSSLADNGMDPSAERQSQDTSDLLVQSFKETTEKTGAFKESSTSSSMDFNINPSAERRSQKTVDLGPQTCEQSRKETRARDRSVIMAPKKKRSKLWDYFEKLKSLLVKCAICKIQIHMPHPSNSTSIMIGHLNRHGIFFNNNTFTLPDDLRQYYSELPEYKAKCNDCSKTMSFLTDIIRLRKHLRRHSTRILS